MDRDVQEAIRITSLGIEEAWAGENTYREGMQKEEKRTKEVSSGLILLSIALGNN